jgi:hypothetical protein
MVTGENKMWPTTRSPCCATSEITAVFEARSWSTSRASADAPNARSLTSRIAATSSGRSTRISIIVASVVVGPTFYGALAPFAFKQPNPRTRHQHRRHPSRRHYPRSPNRFKALSPCGIQAATDADSLQSRGRSNHGRAVLDGGRQLPMGALSPLRIMAPLLLRPDRGSLCANSSRHCSSSGSSC